MTRKEAQKIVNALGFKLGVRGEVGGQPNYRLAYRDPADGRPELTAFYSTRLDYIVEEARRRTAAE